MSPLCLSGEKLSDIISCKQTLLVTIGKKERKREKEKKEKEKERKKERKRKTDKFSYICISTS